MSAHAGNDFTCNIVYAARNLTEQPRASIYRTEKRIYIYMYIYNARHPELCERIRLFLSRDERTNERERATMKTQKCHRKSCAVRRLGFEKFEFEIRSRIRHNTFSLSLFFSRPSGPLRVLRDAAGYTYMHTHMLAQRMSARARAFFVRNCALMLFDQRLSSTLLGATALYTCGTTLYSGLGPYIYIFSPAR